MRQQGTPDPSQNHDRRRPRAEGDHREQSVGDTRRAAGESQEAVHQPAGQKARQDPREQDVRPVRRCQERPDKRPRQAGCAAAGDRREEPTRQDSQGQKPLEHEQGARDD